MFRIKMQDTLLRPHLLQDPHHFIIVFLLMREAAVDAVFPSYSVLFLPLRFSRAVGDVVQGTETEKAVHLRKPFMTGIVFTFPVFKISTAQDSSLPAFPLTITIYLIISEHHGIFAFYPRTPVQIRAPQENKYAETRPRGFLW